MGWDRLSGVHVLVRVWLPDRPGALGLIASRIGAVEGDIVGIDVLERGEAIAVDEFAVELARPELLELMVREIEEVDGASVEEIRVVSTFPDPRLDALESATVLCGAGSVPVLQATLVAHTQREFHTNWSALLHDHELLAGVGDEVPGPDMLSALVAGTSVSPLVADGHTGPEDLAIAPLAGHDATLLLGRSGQPFRRREREQVRALARIADQIWELLA